MIDIILKYSDVFNEVPEIADIPAYHLDTGTSPPVVRKPYRPPLLLKPKIEEEIEELLSLGIIEPSSSPWSSPIIPVPKPGGAVRLCIDFRGVNQLTSQDTYPLPRIDDLLAHVSAAKYLTTLDLSKGYHQIPLDQETREKIAFVCHKGKFQYMRLPLD